MKLPVNGVWGIVFRLGYVVLLVCGVLIYIVFPSNISIFLIIVNIILSVWLIKKWNYWLFFILFFLIFIYFLIVTILPSSSCSSYRMKLGETNSCECIGIQKWTSYLGQYSGISNSRCIGKRIRCYESENWYEISETKREIPCK